MNKFRKDYLESEWGLTALVDQHDRRITELEEEVKRLREQIMHQCKINDLMINVIKLLNDERKGSLLGIINPYGAD